MYLSSNRRPTMRAIINDAKQPDFTKCWLRKCVPCIMYCICTLFNGSKSPAWNSSSPFFYLELKTDQAKCFHIVEQVPNRFYKFPAALKIDKYSRAENNEKYSFLFNTSNVVLGDMLDFFQKHVWITRHAIPISQRPGWNTEHSNPL